MGFLTGISDHGLLAGLADDDHTQYVLRNILTTDGDLFSRDAGAVVRIAAVATGQVFTSAGTGTLPAWSATPVLTSLTCPTLDGGTAANDDITIQGTTHATRTSSYVLLQPNGGNVGIGLTDPINKLVVSGTGTSDSVWTGAHRLVQVANESSNVQLTMTSTYNGYNGNPIIAFAYARGTFAAKTANSVDDILGEFAFYGFTDRLVHAASLRVYADSGWGATESDAPGRIAFETTPDGAGTPVERMRIDSTGKVGIKATSLVVSGTGLLHMNADTFRLDTARTPTSAGAAGNAGDICWDASFIYVCTATNAWERVAIASW